VKAIAGVCLCHRYTLQFLFLGIAAASASPFIVRLIRRRHQGSDSNGFGRSDGPNGS
jgi:hypothetical protein